MKDNPTPTILAALLFFVLVIRGTTNPQAARAWFVVFFEIGVFLSLAAVIWNYDKWVASFLILVTVSPFVVSFDSNSYLAARNVFIGCLWYLFVVMFFNVQNLNMLYRVMRLCAYFHTFVAFMQFIGLAGVFSYSQITGLMDSNMFLSALLCFCLPAFLALKGKRVWLILIPIAGTLMAKQFLGIVTVGVGVIFYLAVARRMYWPTMAIIPAVIAWTYLVDSPGVTHRIFVWKAAIKMWWHRPLLGFGIGHWKTVFKAGMAIDGNRWWTTHNEPLQMLFELGIGSTIIFIGYFISVVRRFTRTAIIPLTALVMIVVQSSATFTMHIAPTAALTVTWLAVLTIMLKEKT